MTITLWEDKQSGLTNSEMDSNFTELANGCIAQSVIDNRPLVKPTLNLDFTKGILDSRITFTRNSTATYFGSDGLLKTAGINQPRFDYDPITRQPKGLLIEEPRSNLLTYSEQFDNAAWTKIGTTVVANNTIAPDGSLTADTITFSSGGYIYQTIYPSFSAGTAYTFSIYTKNSVRALTWGGATPAGTDAWSVTSIGNGWYRQSLTRTFTNAGTGATVQALMNDAYQGTGSFVYWGAQLEQGAFPTSYIPTTSTQTTRNRDVSYISVDSWFSMSGEGTLYAEIDCRNNIISTNYTFFGLYGSSSLINGDDKGFVLYNSFNYLTRNPTSTQPSFGFQIGNNKIAISMDVNGKYGTKNGETIKTSLGNGLNNVLGAAFFSFGGNSGSLVCHTVKKIAYYPKRLTDIQLQEITK